MRILMATGLYPPEIGGPATYTKLLADNLPERGIEVTIIPFREVRAYPKFVRHIAYFFHVVRRARSVDVIFAQDPVSVGLPALLAAKLRRKPFIIRVAGDYAWEQAVQRFNVKDSIDEFQRYRYGWRIELLRRIEAFVVRSAELVITPSKYFKHLVEGWNTKHRTSVITIYNGIRIPEPCTQHPQKRTIISAGRMVPWKGFETLVRLIADMSDWTLRIAGDGPHKQHIEERIREHGVEDRVELLGSISREELRDKLCSSSVFVLNSSFESFSFQLIESMAVGTPVVAADIGNLSEIVTHGENGLLVPADDKHALRQAIERLESNVTLREQIVNNAQHRAKDFTIDKTLDALSKELKKLLNS